MKILLLCFIPTVEHAIYCFFQYSYLELAKIFSTSYLSRKHLIC